MSFRIWKVGIILILCSVIAASSGFLYSMGSKDPMRTVIQPIDFSHELHAGALKIQCLFCHRHATESPTASLPTVSLCMGCHSGLDSDNPTLTPLLVHWKDRKPIQWIRPSRLPDFVYFTHARHLQSGLGCQECHGQVAQMASTPRAPAFEMGWCLSCHTQRGASEDCLTCHK